MNYKKIILLMVWIMCVLPTYAMDSNVDENDENNEKLLDLSFYEDPENRGMLKKILEKADPNIKSTCTGSTPLHLAARHCAAQTPHPEYVSILLAARANPNKRNNNGKSPLHIAATEGSFRAVQLLLNNKAHPNLVNNSGETALHNAINAFVHVDIVAVLLSGNANPNLKAHYNTCLHKAAACTVPEMTKAMQLLLQYGAQVDAINNCNRTPLALLARNYVGNYSLETLSIARKMGRLLVWYQYILLPHFIKQVPEIIPEKAHACAIASHMALICAENKTIW